MSGPVKRYIVDGALQGIPNEIVAASDYDALADDLAALEDDAYAKLECGHPVQCESSVEGEQSDGTPASAEWCQWCADIHGREAVARERDEARAENERLRELMRFYFGAFSNFYAMVEGECPSLIEDDHNALRAEQAIESLRAALQEPPR